MKLRSVGKNFERKIGSLAGVFLLLVVAGCESLGPQALRGGRNDYNSAINQTDVEEFLLNVVRLRFNDKPYVLGIASISAKSEFQVDASATADASRGGSSMPWWQRFSWRC